jgi:allantoicase
MTCMMWRDALSTRTTRTLNCDHLVLVLHAFNASLCAAPASAAHTTAGAALEVVYAARATHDYSAALAVVCAARAGANRRHAFDGSASICPIM